MSGPGDLLVTTPHPFPVGRVAWSPDGRSIVVAPVAHQASPPPAGSVSLIDAQSGAVRWRVEDWSAWSLAVNPNGHSLAVSSTNPAGFISNRTRLLGFETGEELWQVTGPRVEDMAFSPDGRLLATVGRRASLLDADTGALRFDLGSDQPGSGSRTWPLPAFSADSRWVVTTYRGRAFVVDTQTGLKRWDVPLPGEVRRVAFVEGDTQVVICGGSTVHTLDAQTGAVQRSVSLEGEFPVDVFNPSDFGLSPDGRLAIKANPLAMGVYAVADGSLRFDLRTVTTSGTLHLRPEVSPALGVAVVNATEPQPDGVSGGVTLFHPRTGKTVWEHRGRVIDCAFSPDGNRLVVGGGFEHTGFMSVHDMLQSSHLHAGAVTAVAATTGGIRLVATASADGKASVVHPDTGDLLIDRVHPGAVTAIAFSPDGQCFATASTDGGARLFETVSGRVLWTATHGGPVNMIAFIPDGTGVATASADKTARLIGRDSGAELWRHVHPKAVSLVAVSGDGRWVATACADRSTRVLAAATGEQSALFARDGKVRSLAFGPMGSVLASGNEDNSVLLIDPAAGQVVGEVLHPRSVTAVAISRDGSLLASGGNDSVVRLTALGGGTPVLVAHLAFAEPIVKLAFNPVARRLAVVTEDSVVRIVEPVAEGSDLARLFHPATVRDVAFTHDGELLATACNDGYARVFSGGALS